MTTSYRLDEPTQLDESVAKLHEYHGEIATNIEGNLIGLVGDGGTIERVVVSDPLSSEDVTALTDLFGVGVSKTETQ